MILAALALGLGGVFSFGPAEASICGNHADIKKILGERYEETQRAFGIVNDTGLVEVFTSTGGTWSILLTSTTGRSCIIAAGHTWQEMEQALQGPEA
jgi:hypothetical protein